MTTSNRMSDPQNWGGNVRISGRHDWEGTPIHVLLCELFPNHRSPLGYFDVARLSSELGLSYEAVYQWLRKGRLTPQNARTLAFHARETGSREPALSEFESFIYA